MHYLLALTLLLTPTYAIRFSPFGVPTNVLMVWIFVLWAIFALWLVARHHFFHFLTWLRSELVTRHFTLVTLFLLAGIASLFVGGISQEKLGQLLVLFLQPIGTFIIVRYSLSTQHSALSTLITRAALLFVAVSGLYAIIQYLTLLGVPPAWWGNSEEPKRALAFFLHPNFYALFVTPLLAFLVPQVVASDKLQVTSNNSSLYTRHFALVTKGAWLLGAAGLLLSLSRGGWLGLAAAVGVYLLISGNRKLIKSALVMVMVIVIVVLAVPNFRYRLLLPFQGEKSAVSRLSLWHTGWKEIQDSPLLGQGLLGFKNNWANFNTDPNLEPHPTPHNLYLALWVDTGLLGLISFLGLCLLALWRGLRRNRTAYQLGLALAVVAVLMHGLVDTPYLKNDLALLFWVLYSFI